MLSELASQIVASLPRVVAECKQMLFTSSDNVSRSKIYREYTGQGEELPRTFSSFPGFAARLANEVDKMGMTFLLTQAKTE